MDFSKLDQNERLGAIGAAVVVIAGLISTYGGLMWLAILAAIGMLVVVLLPQASPGTTLPGSKGTLMATLGLVAVAAGVITLLQWISVIGALFGSFGTIMLLVAIVGSAVMAWAGWQELQREGGQWRFGTGTTGPTTTTPSANAAAATPPTATTAAPPPASAPVDAEPVPPATSATDTAPGDEYDRPRDA